MKTTHYRADDRRNGYTAEALHRILGRHTRKATVKVVTGFRGQVQRVIVSEPETGKHAAGFDLGQMEDPHFDPDTRPCVAGEDAAWREYTADELKGRKP